MEFGTKSIRPFLGAKDFEISRRFYRDLGFEEVSLGAQMSVFKTGNFAFYLQNAYVKDWIDNTMVFMEVADTRQLWSDLSALDLPSKYENVRLVPIREEAWGREFFVYDPSGILWHFGEFNQP
ncbi:glyoxalase [Flavobacterium sp. MAH-1]|uniref:Glyoxalase n=1 Tax=Flavobacterium agri TaxID=2743471 RepID=A0A7Y9C6H2_9FLAO|nr:glyoxalase [Flavobacterium agri]NUY81410.1 glyoxalase [Flavobacterium agri]NYA71434.1 glyoxalase [Flavobacterium agri]